MAEEAELNLALLCFVAYRATENRVLTDLAAAGFGDITVAQGRVFARIDPDGTRVTDLAERAQVTKQTAGFLVDQLERADYVRRVPDPRDARARLVRISERGLARRSWVALARPRCRVHSASTSASVRRATSTAARPRSDIRTSRARASRGSGTRRT